MELKQYQIDTFTSRVFGGNPAAVCPLKKWLPDNVLQSIAAENNLSETAFFVPRGAGFEIRWFTPAKEVDLCGHATLATAFVLWECLKHTGEKLGFGSRSGDLFVRKLGDRLQLDFPVQVPRACEEPGGFMLGALALEHRPCRILQTDDYFVIFECEEDVQGYVPNFTLLGTIPTRGICITAPGKQADFVSRFFAPRYGIDEDPVTGSSHCALVPYWAKRLQKTELYARQLSRRGGELWCSLKGDRVLIAGQAVKYSESIINVEV